MRGPSVSRRRVVAALAMLGLGAAGRLGAQEPGRVYRIGVLRLSPPDPLRRLERAMALRGFVEGRNLAVEQRFAEGQLDRLPLLAASLLEWRPDVVMAVSAAAARAARAAIETVPIVVFGNLDPIALGLVESLARPGTNLTGVLIEPGTLAAKKLELLREMVGGAERIPFLAADDPNMASQIEETRGAAVALGIAMEVVTATRGDYEAAFRRIVAQRPQALFVGAHTYFWQDRARIIALAAAHRLPAIYEWPEQVEDGGLMSYGTDLGWAYERLAAMIERILKGADPGTIPVEQPDKVELAINLKTAQDLGLEIPPALLLRAQRVVE
jgi:putative tryptophan/tyrosine transport system substrate-binding protein